jgi:cysteine desulfurase
MSRMIYLDAAASTPLDPEVLDAMLPILRDGYGNPSSSHWAGRRAHGLVERAREQVSALTHRRPGAVIFTSGATESNNFAVQGLIASAGSERNAVVSCVTEHPAVLEPLRALADRGFAVHLVGVDATGRIDLDELACVVDERTLLVTVMAANNETGVLAGLDAIAEITHDAGAMLHTDASQLLAWGPLNAHVEIDLVTVSGHKMHGPQGVGALVAGRRAARALRAVQLGGGQERGLRSGTTNVAGVVGLGHAAEIAATRGPLAIVTVKRRRDALQDGLQAELPVALLNGDAVYRLPGTLNIAVGDVDDEVEADAVLANMSTVAASAGSACTSGTPGPSPTLMAMGLSTERALSSLRFGLSRLTSDADVQEALPLVVSAVQVVRATRDTAQTSETGLERVL